VAKWHPQPGCQLAFSSSRSPSAAKSPQLLLGYWPKGKGPASRQQTADVSTIDSILLRAAAGEKEE